ncbi:hypothetical protein ACFQ80_19120 [Isoptericola sp. NPDC056578]|uniref:hypothetical protein n=1 Tax=Isoptericola sp. NPDC056578 TaxID=3345870 RepID=UPI0036CADBB7
MTHIKGPVLTRHIEWGVLRTPMRGGVRVGDRVVPPVIEAELLGKAYDAPAVHMVIQVLDGVPRCTELSLKRVEGGREVRPGDLTAIKVEDWVENFVALCAGELRPSPPGVTVARFNSGPDAVLAGMKTIRDVRKGSRRPLTEARMARVAEVYNAQESGGIRAVELAFTVSRSTAQRHIRAAKKAGLIPEKG